MRHMPPHVTAPENPADTQSSIFASINRNKRSATLDLKKPAAQAALLKMVASYDVLLEQFRPGVMDVWV